MGIMNKSNVAEFPLDTRQLRAFQMVAKTGSFTDAAKALNVSQSAVSHALKALEDDVGCLLLDRLGKRAFLTQAGEMLLERAQNVLAEMAVARSELRQLGTWGHGRLRLGASSTACQYLLPAVLREFKECFPQCSITIAPGDTGAGLELLQQNRIDLVLALEPGNDPRITFRPLFSDELVFVVSPLHPWAKKSTAPPSDIPRQTYILYNRQSYTFALIERYFAQQSLALRSFIELGSMEAIKELVKLGLGVGILAPWVVATELEERSLVSLPLGRRKLKRNWGIFHWKSRRLDLQQETFIGLCQSLADNLRLMR